MAATNKELFVCECSDPDHQFILSFEADEPWNQECYIHVHLSKQSFWRRVRIALAYICGRQSSYGAFQEILLGKDSTIQLRDSLSSIIEKMPDPKN